MGVNYLTFKADDVATILSSEGARERTLKAIQDFFEADRRLTEVCIELGIEKPETVCSK